MSSWVAMAGAARMCGVTPGANSPGARHGKEGDLLAVHPTPKPVALVADAILDCSNRGDIVLDNFLGSGTTLIAAERTGRRGFGVELDPLYVDAAIRRFQAFTRQAGRPCCQWDDVRCARQGAGTRTRGTAMSDDSDSPGYTVGYGRPPAAGQIQAGHIRQSEGAAQGQKNDQKR